MTPHPASSCLAFDHLVVMLRDELEARSPAFEAAGYRLSPPGYHNLGSMNRLIVLDSSYIELLGWPQGTEPKRKEIALQPLGLDALVFRSAHAEADQQRLAAAGFDVQPVSHLERPLEVDGDTAMARFRTVRFNTQPVDGLRVYYCEHLTPQHIWNEALCEHPNGVRRLHHIALSAPDAPAVADILARLANTRVTEEDGRQVIPLQNAVLTVRPAPGAAAAQIERVVLGLADGTLKDFAFAL